MCEPVHSIGVIVIEVLYTFIKLGAPLWLINGQIEETDVSIEWELVHGVNATHVIENEEQNGCSLRTWAIGLQHTHDTITDSIAFIVNLTESNVK